MRQIFLNNENIISSTNIYGYSTIIGYYVKDELIYSLLLIDIRLSIRFDLRSKQLLDMVLCMDYLEKKILLVALLIPVRITLIYYYTWWYERKTDSDAGYYY